MGEPSRDAEYLALLREQDWGNLMADLVLFGRGKKRLSQEDAERLAADAIARACDPRQSPWDASRGTSLLTHLMWVFDRELARSRQRTDATGNLAELRDKLFASVTSRPLAQELLVLEEEEQISDIDEQVRLTRATRPGVYEARRFLATTARELVAGAENPQRDALALQRRDTLRSVKKVSE